MNFCAFSTLYCVIFVYIKKLISCELTSQEVDLVVVDLIGVDFVGVDLVGVDLVGVDLVRGHQLNQPVLCSLLYTDV